MQMRTIPVRCFWVICHEDDDLNEEFGCGQFKEADNYLNKMRGNWTNKTFEMIAEIDA